MSYNWTSFLFFFCWPPSFDWILFACFLARKRNPFFFIWTILVFGQSTRRKVKKITYRFTFNYASWFTFSWLFEHESGRMFHVRGFIRNSDFFSSSSSFLFACSLVCVWCNGGEEDDDKYHLVTYFLFFWKTALMGGKNCQSLFCVFDYLVISTLELECKRLNSKNQKKLNDQGAEKTKNLWA